MSREEDNKTVVVRWFTEFWGESCNLAVVDDIAAPDMGLRLKDGKIVEEIGLDDGVTALTQLGLLKAA